MKSQAGFENQIRQYYREMYLPMLQYARSILTDTSLAEEAVQEAFRIACEKPAELVGSPNPKGWLMRTLKNVLRNMQRGRARLSRLVTASLDREGCLVDASVTDEHVDLEYSDLLSPDDYRLLKFIVLEDGSMLEAAQEFGISVEACRKRVQRAKRKLQKKLREIDQDLSSADSLRTYRK